MNNITKNRQSKEQLHKIIEKAFQGKVTLTDYRELTDGFCNVAYDLVLSDGRQAILKIAPPTGVQMMSCEAELMKTEVFAMRRQSIKFREWPGFMLMMTAESYVPVSTLLWRSLRGRAVMWQNRT